MFYGDFSWMFSSWSPFLGGWKDLLAVPRDAFMIHTGELFLSQIAHRPLDSARKYLLHTPLISSEETHILMNWKAFHIICWDRNSIHNSTVMKHFFCLQSWLSWRQLCKLKQSRSWHFHFLLHSLMNTEMKLKPHSLRWSSLIIEAEMTFK